MTTGRINQVSILSNPANSRSHLERCYHEPTRLTLPSRARVFDWILKFWVPRTGRLLPESNTTRLKYRSRSPTERSSRVQPALLKQNPRFVKTINRFTQADPSSEPLATAIDWFSLIIRMVSRVLALSRSYVLPSVIRTSFSSALHAG